MLMHNHGYSLTELDSMLPWEREIYCALLVKHNAEKAKQQT